MTIGTIFSLIKKVTDDEVNVTTLLDLASNWKDLLSKSQETILILKRGKRTGNDGRILIIMKLYLQIQ